MTEHLTMIQNVIHRLGSNSFLIRGWTVTIAAALFALAAKDSNVRFVVVAYFVVVMFWLLDGYYLHQERSFRSLYDAVRTKDTRVTPFSMDTRPFRTRRDSWPFAMFSRTMCIFHGCLLLVVIAVTWILF